ncbi:uncharacterized protein LOC134257054 [Saccostrea cucullata]|uniref:uncharacterized protein LOC134257054 n=1 Tax=Saccostrea cuccullata TaxID=36930 RepID=UPI002ED0A560
MTFSLFTANIEISSNEVIYGDTVILVTNVTWHPSFNVTGFQWSKDGQELDNSSRKYEIGNLPLPSLTIYNATFEDDASYRIDVYITHYGFEDTARETYYLIISGHSPKTKLKINHAGSLLGEPLEIVCKLLDRPSPNILYYRLERKRESDLIPEILQEMSANETFDNTSVFVARFFTQNVTILDYSEYRCITTNLISTKVSSHYLNIKSGESKRQGHVYIPNLDKVLYRTFTLKSRDDAEMECQKRNGTLYQITSLERQIYLEKLFRETWSETWGNTYAFISGERFGGFWKINNSVPSFTYWSVSYPDNNDDHNCIAQYMIPSYRWINVTCTEELPYICEFPPYCEEAHLPNATVEPGSTYIFTRRDYNCIGGNKMTPYLECLEHLQWQGGCEIIICSIPEGVHSHALINKTYYFNETLEFQCDYGYKEDSGVSSLICGENNTWNNEPLKCTRIVCDVVNVTNARIITTDITSTTLPFGTCIDIECLPGFILSSGGYNNTCLLSGAWSNLPVCTAPACPKESINSSVYVINHLDGYNISDNMSLSCNTGYRHGGGDLNRTCQGSGVWSAPLPQCNRCKCPCDRVHPVQNLTTEELNNKIEELKKELVVNARTLSSSIRKRTSASDERPSATGVGVILGVGILTFLCAIIFIPDIPKLTHDIRNNAAIQYLTSRFFSR